MTTSWEPSTTCSIEAVFSSSMAAPGSAEPKLGFPGDETHSPGPAGSQCVTHSRNPGIQENMKGHDELGDWVQEDPGGTLGICEDTL